MRQSTLCFLVKGNEISLQEICLAMKKRGFGVGRFNGVGGKVQEGETVEQATKRETLEEIGVVVQEMEQAAILTFLFPHQPQWDQIVHVFLCSQWEGIPQESEEMTPQWFSINEIPFSTMWSDDPYWLPLILQGKHIRGTFSFDEQDQVIEHSIHILS